MTSAAVKAIDVQQGRRTPAEIAVSILAQMIAVESGASGATGL